MGRCVGCTNYFICLVSNAVYKNYSFTKLRVTPLTYLFLIPYEEL